MINDLGIFQLKVKEGKKAVGILFPRSFKHFDYMIYITEMSLSSEIRAILYKLAFPELSTYEKGQLSFKSRWTVFWQSETFLPVRTSDLKFN